MVFKDRAYQEHILSIATPDLANFGGQKYSSPAFQSAMQNPLGLASMAQITRNMMLDKKDDLSTLLVYTLAKAGNGVRRDLVGDPISLARRNSKKPNSLVLAIEKVFSRSKKKAPAKLSETLKNVPKDIQELVALLIETALLTSDWHKKAFSKVQSRVASVQKELLNDTNYVSELGKGLSPLIWDFADQVDLNYISSGAVDLAVALEDVETILTKRTNTESFKVSIATPMGHIVLNGIGEDNVTKGPILLSLDLGGNDSYVKASGSDFLKPVNLVIDVSGNDFYGVDLKLKPKSINTYKDRKKLDIPPDQAAGFFGYSYILDLEGDDVYRGRSFAQGSGVFGVGILKDVKGQDVYDCYSYCQAASLFGAGLLLDYGGADSYFGFHAIQAFASTSGASLLLDDGKESDRYTAYSEPLDFPSMIDPKVNSSFAQASALGHRADFIDGHSWSGGVAILIDGGGNNEFSAGFFAQGFSYWYALSMLLTSEGNDNYTSGKYSQGSATHFGIGILYDKGGDDHYSVKQELGLGVGHDFAYGVFVDLKGNDTYESVNLSLGCGSANGMGFFWDNQGNDSYKIGDSQFMGCAIDRVGRHSLRNRNKTIGVFVDADGKDKLESQVSQLKGTIGKKIVRHDPGVVKPKFSKPWFLGAGFFLSEPMKTFPDGVSISDSQEF